MDFIDLRGTWVNEFGSEMVIDQLDRQTGVFSGTYSSTTGATGVYYVTGITDIKPDPEVNSQTVSFSISWRSFKPEKDETGYNWTSAFAGQLQVVDGKEQIATTYLLQKNSEPDENWGATVVATALFKRKS